MIIYLHWYYYLRMAIDMRTTKILTKILHNYNKVSGPYIEEGNYITAMCSCYLWLISLLKDEYIVYCSYNLSPFFSCIDTKKTFETWEKMYCTRTCNMLLFKIICVLFIFLNIYIDIYVPYVTVAIFCSMIMYIIFYNCNDHEYIEYLSLREVLRRLQ